MAKGDLLVQLDREPYEIQVNVAQAAVEAVQSDVVAADAECALMKARCAAGGSASIMRLRKCKTRLCCCDRKWRR